MINVYPKFELKQGWICINFVTSFLTVEKEFPQSLDQHTIQKFWQTMHGCKFVEPNSGFKNNIRIRVKGKECHVQTKLNLNKYYATPAWKYCTIYTQIQAITEWILLITEVEQLVIIKIE